MTRPSSSIARLNRRRSLAPRTRASVKVAVRRCAIAWAAKASTASTTPTGPAISRTMSEVETATRCVIASRSEARIDENIKELATRKHITGRAELTHLLGDDRRVIEAELRRAQWIPRVQPGFGERIRQTGRRLRIDECIGDEQFSSVIRPPLEGGGELGLVLPEIVVGIGRPVQTGDPQRSDVEGEQVTHGDAHLLRCIARDGDLHGRGGRAALEIVVVTLPCRRRSPVGDLHLGEPAGGDGEAELHPDDPGSRSDDLHLVAIGGRRPLRRLEQRGQGWPETRGCALDRVGDRGQPFGRGAPAPR